MSDCAACVHSIFDETWGEYKCKVKKITIYDIKDHRDCKSFKKQPRVKKDISAKNN